MCAKRERERQAFALSVLGSMQLWRIWYRDREPRPRGDAAKMRRATVQRMSQVRVDSSRRGCVCTVLGRPKRPGATCFASKVVVRRTGASMGRSNERTSNRR